MEKLIKYVNPHGPLPAIAGTKNGSLLVIGSAAGVWEDLRGYDAKHGDQNRMGINDMMSYYPGRLTHGATLHSEKWSMWRCNQNLEAEKHGWPLMITHSHVPNSGPCWPLTRDGGTSGLFGVFIGLLMGYERVILAGIPCDDSPRFIDPPWKKHEMFGKDDVFVEWSRVCEAVPVFKNRVRSLSGRTRDLLGSPDD